MERLIDPEEETVEEPAAVGTEEVRRPVNPPREVSRSNAGLLRAVLLILLAVILVVLIVLFARWLYHATHHTSQSTQTGTNPASQTSSPLKKQPTSQSQTNRPSSNPATTPANNSLPNSGAGNVIAIFAGASLAATGLHYIISVRRFAKSRP